MFGPCAVTPSNTDLLVIGKGFIGQFQDLLVFSPSSAYVANSTLAISPPRPKLIQLLARAAQRS